MYAVPNMLSESECKAFIDRAKALESTRPMKRSNPPEVSLDVRKLWPLSLLSLAAGIPPLVRFYAENESEFPSMDQIVTICLPPVVLAFAGSLVLAFGVVLPLIRKFSESSSRTSFAMALNLDEDIPHITNLVDTVCNITQHPWTAWEAPVFTRYNPGAIFSLHSDASPTRGSEWKDIGGQRVITCICYLNTVEKGGATHFDKLRLKVAPEGGKALVFFPTRKGDPLEADNLLTHESMVAEEEKCIIQMFGRVGPRVSPPLGLPDSYKV